MPEGGRETTPGVTFLAQPRRVDRAIAKLATSQHGVFTLGQLRDLGLQASTVRRRVAAARLHRIHRRVYSLVPPMLLKREGHWMAAVLAGGPDAILSHRDAAALHQLMKNNRTRLEITVPRPVEPQTPRHRRPPLHDPDRN